MSSFVSLLKKYAKFLPLAVATVASAIVGAVHPGMTHADWAHVAILGLGALSVGIAPNVPGYKYVKETIAALTAVVTILVTGFTGFDANSVIQIALAVAAAFGVTGLKNIGDYYHIVTTVVAPKPALAAVSATPVVAPAPTATVSAAPVDAPKGSA
jgi:hypothetical protein